MAMYQGKYTEQGKPIRTATDKLLSRVEARYKSDVKNKKKLPKYQVAGLTEQEKRAIELAGEGIGSYQPYLDTAASGLATGVGTLGGATGVFTGQGREQFMDPYEEQVVAAGQRDLREQGAQALNQERARGLSAAAFGRSGRAARGQERVMADTAQQVADFGARMRSEGYGKSMDYARDAFEDSKNRAYQVGLGQAGIGMDYAGLGGDVQRMGQGDVSFLSQIGGGQRDYAQSQYDADRMTAYQNYMQPYQQLGFMGDILGGVPSGSSTYGMQPAASPYTQYGGLMGQAGAGYNYFQNRQ